MTNPGILLSGQVIGNESVVGALKPDATVRRVRETVKVLGYQLQRYVQEQKLKGQVLKRRSGAGSRSINTAFSETPDTFSASVGTNLVYMRAWELGFTIPARIIVAKNKQALFWPGAAHPVKSVQQYARSNLARPFLKPALLEMAPKIRAALTRSLAGT